MWETEGQMHSHEWFYNTILTIKTDHFWDNSQPGLRFLVFIKLKYREHVEFCCNENLKHRKVNLSTILKSGFTSNSTLQTLLK